MPTLEDTEDATCEHVLFWMCRVEAQRVKKTSLNDVMEAKDFDTVKQIMQIQDHAVFKMHKRRQMQILQHRTPPSIALHIARSGVGMGKINVAVTAVLAWWEENP